MIEEIFDYFNLELKYEYCKVIEDDINGCHNHIKVDGYEIFAPHYKGVEQDYHKEKWHRLCIHLKDFII